MMYCRSIPTTDDRTDYRKGGNVQSSYERMMYQLSPPPSLFDDLQEYIDLYFAEKDDKYFTWFLHYYEPRINAIVSKRMRHYKMDGHFIELKSACISGIWQAVLEYEPDRGVPFIAFMQRFIQEQILDYVRIMRPTLTVPKDSTYRNQRRIMAVFSSLGGRFDDETITGVAQRLGIKEDTVCKHIRLALRSQDAVSIESLAENEEDDSSERLYSNNMSEPEYAFFAGRRSDMLFEAFDELEYRESDIVAARLDFCMECGQVIERDINGLDRTKEKKPTFEDLANNYGLRSANAAEKKYYRAIERMRARIAECGDMSTGSN